MVKVSLHINILSQVYTYSIGCVQDTLVPFFTPIDILLLTLLLIVILTHSCCALVSNCTTSTCWKVGQAPDATSRQVWQNASGPMVYTYS